MQTAFCGGDFDLEATGAQQTSCRVQESLTHKRELYLEL